jgi:biotin carboxyl carrier protein
MNPLRDALDAVLASGPDLARAQMRFAADLLNSDGHQLLSLSADGKSNPAVAPDMLALAEAAARAGVAVVGRGAALRLTPGAGHGADDRQVEVALFRLPDESRVGQALARERLELVHALARSQAASDGPAMPDPFSLARSGWSEPELRDLALRLAEAVAAPRLVLGVFTAFGVRRMADSRAERLSAETRRELELALGEVADSGRTVLDAGQGGFTGLDRLAAGDAVRALASLSPDGDGLVALLWPPGDARATAAAMSLAAPIAAARLNRPGLAERFDRTARAAPWPPGVPVEVRPRLARRLLLGLAVLLALLPLPDRVRAPLAIEPRVARVLTAPVTARIEAVAVEPGDRVAAGALLVRLDSAAIDREREEAAAQFQAASAAAAAARAEGDVQGERMAQLSLAQLAGRVARLDERLAETEVRAPVAGTVTGEDLRRRVGATLTRGELLFRIAAPLGYRAELLVGDSDVPRVAVGAPVAIRLSSRPLARIDGRVVRIYPLAETVSGRNVFRTIAEIDASQVGHLQAGMSGTGWVSSGWSPLAWQAIRPAVRWLRLRLWL